MVNLDLEATYDGMDVVETYKEVEKLRALGFSDDLINKMLEEHKDKEQDHE